MTERDFAYWLRGVLEVTKPKTLNEEQIKIIEQHLDLVLKKVTGLTIKETGTNGYLQIPGYLDCLDSGRMC